MEWYRNTCQAMARGAIQFQKGLSLPEFHRLNGSEENGLVYGRILNRN